MTTGGAAHALVTGAARRIGRAIALDLAQQGWAVAIHYRSSGAEAEELRDAVVALGGRAVTVQADLAREDEAAALLPRAAAALGPITCVVNNASLFERDTVGAAPLDLWQAHMATNLRAPYVLAEQLARQLPAGVAGNVINLIDQGVLNPRPGFLSYTISKSALWTLTRVLAQALAPTIRVNAIGPGPVLRSVHQSEEQFEQEWHRTPLGVGATLEEICGAVRFLLATPSLTGQMIVLDGGQHLSRARARSARP
jgi:NAD(P)-dependent dehydrogenase (short-subunit alcohol dehydrogenase family)